MDTTYWREPAMAARFDNTTTLSVRQQAMALLSQLPDEITWQQLAYEFEMAAGVAQSIEENEIADPAVVAALFERAGIHLAP